MAQGNGRSVDDGGYSDIGSAFKRAVPQLHSLVWGNSEDFVSLHVRRRSPNDFIAVVKRWGSDGQGEVVFGNGFDLYSTLLGLDGSLAAGRWKLDVPYEDRQGGE